MFEACIDERCGASATLKLYQPDEPPGRVERGNDTLARARSLAKHRPSACECYICGKAAYFQGLVRLVQGAVQYSD